MEAVHASTGRTVLLVKRTRQIAPSDAFDGDHLRAASDSAASAKRLAPSFADPGGDAVVVDGNEMVRAEVDESLEPEGAHLVEDPPLVRHTIGHHDIEGADSVRGDDQQGVAEIVYLPNLASLRRRKAREAGFEEGSHRFYYEGGRGKGRRRNRCRPSIIGCSRCYGLTST